MFPLPESELIIGFGLYPTLPKSQLQPVLEQLNLLTNLALQMGGKRYMASWAEFALPQWRLQFGNYWTKVNEMKTKYDPNGILNPGFFQYEQFARSQTYKQQTQLTKDVSNKLQVAV
jgi:cytokinin dehydrogenase